MWIFVCRRCSLSLPCRWCKVLDRLVLPTQVNPNLWPAFLWLDGSASPAVLGRVGGYSHWGSVTLPDGSSASEPNNMVPPEFCATASFHTSYNSVWGWSDQNCDERHIFICKLLGEWVLLSPAASPPTAAFNAQTNRSECRVKIHVHVCAGPMPPSPPVLLPPSSPPPPMNPVFSLPDGMVYLYNTSRATFRGALAACTAWGGTLVQVSFSKLVHYISGNRLPASSEKALTCRDSQGSYKKRTLF